MNVVFLTGMHRSGTSMVSRVVNLLGADLGPESALMPAKDDNPSGFWENREVIGFNDDLLASLGGRWDEPPVLVDGWERSEALDDLRVRAAAIISELAGREASGDVLVLKDPRSSLLLPFWSTVTPLAASVLTIRHPGQVAGSLADRNRLDSEASAYLWLRYVVAAWRGDPKRLVVRFSDLFDDRNTQVLRLVDHLGLPAPSPETRAAIGEFIDPGLRHHVARPVEGGPAMALAMSVYELLSHQNGVLLDPLMEGLHERWLGNHEIIALRARLDGIRKELETTTVHRNELIGERDVAVKRGTEMDATLIEVVRHRNQLQVRNGELEQLVSIAEAQAKEYARYGDELAAERDAAADQRDHLAVRLRVQRESIESTEDANRLLRSEVARQEAISAGLAEERDGLERQVRRWRVDRWEALLRKLHLLR